MDDMSKPSTRIERKCLRLEELEERIAPVIVTADPATWIQGLDVCHDGYVTSPDSYWIFYVGPGQADIGPGDTAADLNGQFITSITIDGSTLDSGLFILDFPKDATPGQNTVPWPVNAGTIQVLGDITVNGDLGCLEIDGLFGNSGTSFGFPVMTVNGTLGKFDVGVLMGDINVVNGGDLYELDVDTLIGVFYDIQVDAFQYFGTVTIAAEGNIGAVRVGVGLADRGESITTPVNNVLGGCISGSTTIRANSDSSSDPGIIDLIEVRSGSLSYMGAPGSLGLAADHQLPTISAGPGGNVRFMNIEGTIFIDGTTLNSIHVTSASSAAERTVVDDSGGVLVVTVLDTTFTSGTATITYPGDVEMWCVPVDRATQGPGAVIARLVATGSNDFTVRGSVEIGDFQIAGDPSFPEGLTADLTRLAVASIEEIPNDFTTLINLTGFAHDTIGAGPGGGHSDIYLLESSGIIPIVCNNTQDGDILAVHSSMDIMLVSASRDGGDIGATASISPYILRGPLHFIDGDIPWVDTSTNADSVVPFGIEGNQMRYNSIYGVLCDGGTIYGLRAGGAIGDVRLPVGGARLIEANSNDVRDPGSPLVSQNIIVLPAGLIGGGTYSPAQGFTFFGRAQNTVGDGIFGKVFSGLGVGTLIDAFSCDPATGIAGGGPFTLVKVGEGLDASALDIANVFPSTSPFPLNMGTFVTAGIFSGDFIGTVMVSGHGRGIFGDIIAEQNAVLEDGTTGSGIDRVAALDGARIDGTRSYAGYIVIWGGFLDAAYAPGSGILTSNINTVIADGPGAIMDHVIFIANNISNIVATDSTDGIVNSYIDTIEGSLGRVAAGGPGMDNVAVEVHGPARIIETTGPASIMSNCYIAVRASLGTLSTNALSNDSIDVLTIGNISSFDFIQHTGLRAGGLRTITVHNDIFDGSLIQVAGPLNVLNVGGDITDSTIEATGPSGDIGRINVKGNIANSEIFSTGSIAKIDVFGGISADITTLALTKNNPTSITAGGAVSGDWQFANELKSLKTTWLGNVNAVINAAAIGTITADGTISGNITTPGNAGKIIARGNITGNINVGDELGTLQSVEGSIRGNVVVTEKVGSVMAANDVGSAVGPLHSVLTAGGPVGKILAGSSKTVGDIVADISVFEGVKSMQATGDITGIIDIGSLGTMRAAGAIVQDIDIAGQAGSITSGGTLGHSGSHLNVGLGLGRLSVGTSSAPANNVSDVGIGGRLGSLAVTGSMPGNLTVGDGAGSIAIGGDAGQSGQLWQIVGSLGRMDVGKPESLSDLIAAVDVTGSLGRLNVPGALYDNFTVGGNAGTIDIGQVFGSPADLTLITIGGNLNKITSGSVLVPVTPHFFNINDSGIHTGDLTVGGTIKHLQL